MINPGLEISRLFQRRPAQSRPQTTDRTYLRGGTLRRCDDIHLDPIGEWAHSVVEVLGLLTAQGWAKLPGWTVRLPADKELQAYITDGEITRYFTSDDELITYLRTIFRMPLIGNRRT